MNLVLVEGRVLQTLDVLLKFVEGENGADYGGSEEMLDDLTPLHNVPQLVECRLSLCIALKLYPQHICKGRLEQK